MKRLISSVLMAILFPLTHFAGDVSTRFSIYVPPNNSAGRQAMLIVTSIQDGANVRIIDDEEDGDKDDSWSGVLDKGDTYLMVLADGSVNDDYGGKADGDYFRVISDKPVLVSEATRSDWQHDFVPSDNKTMIGSTFYVFAPPTLMSKQDLNIFAYTDNTIVYIKELTSSAKLSTGRITANLKSPAVLRSFVLNVGKDIIYNGTEGQDILEGGKTYLIQATNPVSVQSGALFGSARDGGAYVPCSNGSNAGNLFYFGVPYQYSGEQEIRLVSFNDDNLVTLSYYENSSKKWIDIQTWTLSTYQTADWVAKAGVAYGVFRVTASVGKKVAVFEANWLETGSPGTSDIGVFLTASDGSGAGTRFVVYLPPPGIESSAINPKTGKKYPTEKMTHIYVYAQQDSTHCWIVDRGTFGQKLSNKFTVDKDGYHDWFVNLDQWKSIYNGTGTTSGPERPYVEVITDKPVSVMLANWNDNWMAYANSILTPSFESESAASVNKVAPNEDFTFRAKTKNTSESVLKDVSTTVSLENGLELKKSDFKVNEKDLGGGEIKTDKKTNIVTITVSGFDLNPGDSITATIQTTAGSTYKDGTSIPNGAVLSATSTTSAIDNEGNVVETTHSDGISISTLTGGTEIKTTTLAFEDLYRQSWNDWDFNDWVVGVKATKYLTVDQLVERATLTYTPLARGAVKDHLFKQTLTFNGEAQISKSIYEADGTLVSVSAPVTYRDGATVTIFESTKTALPPEKGFTFTNTERSQLSDVKGQIVVLSLVLNSPAKNPQSDFSNFHDPFLVLENKEEIHVRSLISNLPEYIQNLDNVESDVKIKGFDLDLALSLPEGWRWPLESKINALWASYPQFESFILTGKTSQTDWATLPENSKVRHSGAHQISSGQFFQKERELSFTAIPSEMGSLVTAVSSEENGKTVLLTISQFGNVYKQTGSDLPVKIASVGAMVRSNPSLLNFQGESWLAFGDELGRLNLIGFSGNQTAGFPVQFEHPIKSSPVSVGTGESQFLILAAGDGKIYKLGTDGVLVTGWPKEFSSRTDEFGQFPMVPTPAVGDVNGDGLSDIVMVSPEGRLNVFSEKGDFLTGYPMELGHGVITSPILVSLDASPGKEIIIVSTDGSIFVQNFAGDKLSGFPLELNDGVSASPAAGDLDHDGKMEIVVATETGKLFAIGQTGKILPNFPVVLTNGITSAPLVAQLDGKPGEEILVVAENGTWSAWNQFGEVTDETAINSVYRETWTQSPPLLYETTEGTGKLILTSVTEAPLILDFLQFDSDSSSWTTFMGNQNRTGNLTKSYSISGGADTALIKTSAFNMPNPVRKGSSTTTLVYRSAIGINTMSVSIFDLGGELVKTWRNDSILHSSTDHYVVWDLKNADHFSVANGVYLAVLKGKNASGKDFETTIKIAVLR
ncbi:MAG: LruC domain-containing protein [Bacteroidetes bacterium]|nr:LruC domain-containing protein [Bacteroidota bacterium]